MKIKMRRTKKKKSTICGNEIVQQFKIYAEKDKDEWTKYWDARGLLKGADGKRNYLNITDGVIKNIHKDFKNKTCLRRNIDFIRQIIAPKYGLMMYSPCGPFKVQQVSMVHMGIKKKGGGIKFRKGIGSDTAGHGRPFITHGKLIGIGNKCCAVLLDPPWTYDEQDITQFKNMRNAYNKGRGMIKKVIYEESVIKFHHGEEFGADIEDEINEELTERGWVL